MNRRNFLKALGLTPLVGILGFRKAGGASPIISLKPLVEGELGTLEGVNWISEPSKPKYTHFFLFDQFHKMSISHPRNLGLVVCKDFKELREMTSEYARRFDVNFSPFQKSAHYDNQSRIIFTTADRVWNYCSNLNLGWWYQPRGQKYDDLASRLRLRLRRKDVPHCRITNDSVITWSGANYTILCQLKP